MSVNFLFVNQTYSNDILLFYNENFEIKNISKLLNKKKFLELNQFLRLNKDISKQIVRFNINSKQSVILARVKKNETLDNEKLGADVFSFLKTNELTKIDIIYQNINEFFSANDRFLSEFLYGIESKSYNFDKYKKKNLSKNYIILELNENQNMHQELDDMAIMVNKIHEISQVNIQKNSIKWFNTEFDEIGLDMKVKRPIDNQKEKNFIKNLCTIKKITTFITVNN